MRRSLKFISPVLFLGFSLGALQNSAAQSASSSASASEAYRLFSDKSQLQVGTDVFVAKDDVNARSAANLSEDSILGQFSSGDLVKVLSRDHAGDFVKVQVVGTRSHTVKVNQVYYVSFKMLTDETVHFSYPNPSRYFVVQNIATEKARVYEYCNSSPDCSHRLVMETDIVVGRMKGDKKDQNQFLTWAGWYTINYWKKFHENPSYPSWYDSRYPALPEKDRHGQTAGSPGAKWISKKLLPLDLMPEAHYRGAFGWYAAILTHNPNDQWLHGTYGYGADEDIFIQMPKNGEGMNLFERAAIKIAGKDLRSAGCTRFENKAIAYLQSFLTPGTNIFRVYALEGYQDESRSTYQDQQSNRTWEYILTKEDVRRSGPRSSDANSVRSRGLSADQILDQGSYEFDQYPNATGFDRSMKESDQRKGKTGNVYGISPQKFQGVFFVDSGRFYNYRHPQDEKITVSGVGKQEDGTQIPSYLQKQNLENGSCLMVSGKSSKERSANLETLQVRELRLCN